MSRISKEDVCSSSIVLIVKLSSSNLNDVSERSWFSSFLMVEGENPGLNIMKASSK